jgi:DNA adenine methylase
LTRLWSYPGGKASIAKWLVDELPEPSVFHEPFVGSGAVAIAVAERYPHTQIKVNDLDRYTSSVWKCIADPKKTRELAARITDEPKPTTSTFEAWLNTTPRNVIERALRSIFLSKTSFSGLSRTPIGGKNQQSAWGVNIKWKPERIVGELERLTNIFSGRLTVGSMDILTYLEQIESTDVVYLDPPYFKAGRLCYQESMTSRQHIELSLHLEHLNAPWLLSYDNAPEIKMLYSWAKVDTISMIYRMSPNNQKWKPKNELLIRHG